MIADSTSKLYRWEKWSGKLPDDAIYTSQYNVVARTKVDGKYVLANYDLGNVECNWGRGVTKFVKDFEILVAEPDSVVEWVDAYLGDYPLGGVPVNEDEQYVARGVSGSVEKRMKSAYISPNKQMAYIVCQLGNWILTSYQALVVRDPSNLKAAECSTPFAWCTWEGLTFRNAVHISERYVVGRSCAGDKDIVIYGQLDLENCQFKLVWEGSILDRWPNKVDVLVHSKNAIVEWVPYDCGQETPANSIGYDLTSGTRYVGRISNALTAGEYVPGMIDKTNKKFIYIREGKIVEDKKCEILVIKNLPKKRD